jgi:phosphomannomutase
MSDRSIEIAELMDRSGVKFGTSGARGLVEDMTDEVCFAYTLGFLQHLEQAGEIDGSEQVGIGGDLRPSTERIMAAVAQAVMHKGHRPLGLGRVPSPALAFWGLQQRKPTIMVTGSHIPADRNGIKYTKRAGEILKDDEAAIKRQRVELPADLFGDDGMFVRPIQPLQARDEALDLYARRYLDFFPADCLAGKRLGVYEHSAVGRDVLVRVCQGLGAEVSRLGRSEAFIPVDTEAIRPEDVEAARHWATEHGFDAILSTDGDSDRPLVADENGKWLRGDVAGILCAAWIEAEAVVTPVSCNSAVEKSGLFERVIRTRIGSPYVIAAMQQAERDGRRPVAGYEANGGFLLQTPVERWQRRLEPLPTRDTLLLHLAVLLRAAERGCSVSALVAELPQRFTYSDRLKRFPTEKSHAKLAELNSGDFERDRAAIEAVFGEAFGRVAATDDTDGLRITFANDEVVHLRPSGNAPEFRCYTEADSEQRARDINATALEIMERWR